MKKSRTVAEMRKTARGRGCIGVVPRAELIVNISEAKAQWSRLVARVEQGGRVVISRAGKPVAVLQPIRK